MLKTATTAVLNRILTGMPVAARIPGIDHCVKPAPRPAPGKPCKKNEDGEKKRMRILLITAEQKAAWALKEELESKRCEAMTAHSAEEGFYLLSTGRFDLVLLDPMLPGRDGVELLMVLRRSGIKTPVLFHSPEDLYMDARRIVALCQAMEAGSPGEWPNVLAVKNSEARPGTGTGLPLKAHCIHSQGNPG